MFMLSSALRRVSVEEITGNLIGAAYEPNGISVIYFATSDEEGDIRLSGKMMFLHKC